MTATITPPPGVPSLARIDPKLRLDDYVAALEFYLSVSSRYIDRIVFVDNSNSDVTRLRELVHNRGGKKDVEFITYDGLDFPPKYGRGYGEFRLLDYALDRSRLLAELAPNNVFWKVTGRLRVLNIERLIASAPERYDFYGECKRYPHKRLHLRVYSATICGYNIVFRADRDDLREDTSGTIPEHTLFYRLMKCRRNGGIVVVPRLRQVPKYSGVGASRNIDYLAGMNRFKYWGRAATRRLVPWWWV